MSRPSARRGRRDTGRGQALVEFALVIPIVVLLIVAVFDIGRAVFTYTSITNAAREGARLAIVNQDLASVQKRTIDQAGGLDPDPTHVTLSFRRAGPNADPLTNAACGTPTIGCIAVVQFTTQWAAITPLIGNIIGPMSFTARSAVPVEFVCPSTAITLAADCPKQP